MRFLVLIFLLSFPVLAHAQIDTADVPDTVLTTGPVQKESRGFVMRKSPALAVVYGLIPGGGQIYTEQYWKAPLFAVPIGVLVGVGVYNHGLYNDYADQVRALELDSTRTFELSVAKSRRDLYQDRRDLSYAVGGIIFLLSLMDAYVGAHLYDFDVSDTLSSIYIYPDAKHNGIGLGVRW